MAMAQPSATSIPFRAQGLSGDGRVVVGTTLSSSTPHALLWTRNTGTIDLGIPESFTSAKATATNWDGSVVAIVASRPGGVVGSWIWTQADGLISVTIPGFVNMQASCVSRDGLVVAGSAVDPSTSQYVAVRWSLAEGGRTVPQAGNHASWIHALSPDGLKAAGNGSSGLGTWPVFWPSTYSWCEGLGDVPGQLAAYGYAMTPDGSTITGGTYGGNDPGRAYVWTARDGIQALNQLSTRLGDELLALSDDGTVGGGCFNCGYIGGGAIWRPGVGLMPASDYFRMYGLNVGPETIVGISANGRVFCALNMIIDLGACGSVDFNHDGEAGTDADIEAFFNCLAGHCCPLCDSADFNGDGDAATDADIEAFFRVLGGGNC
jgi:hypothetical protein